MKDSELDRLLKSAPVPERTDAYWETFPGEVMAQIGARSAPTPRPTVHRPLWRARAFRLAAVGLGLVLVGLLAGLAIGFHQGRNLAITNAQATEARKYFNEISALFPGQVQAIIFDRQGAHLMLADRPDVPSSTPLYLKISGPDGSRSVVTFSGQRLPINGENCDVLLDQHGRILVVGPRWALSATRQPVQHGHYWVAGRPLETGL